jgi:CheY-like chemotaxis protein
MNRDSAAFTDLPVPAAEVSEGVKHFDLTILIKQDNLGTRAIAETVNLMTVGEYCELLEQFVGLAPDISGIIRKFSRMDFNLDKKDYKKLEQMIHLLESMMCEKFAVDFHFLKNAYRKKSNWELAAVHAGQIIDSFDGLYKQVKGARQLDAETAGAYEDLFLKNYLDKVDRENAGRKPVILAIDDSPDILKAIYSVLKDKYKVIPLSNPLLMESTLQHITPDLFLLDYRMPEINGLDLIPVIRSFDRHKDTPVIFLTSAGTIDHESAAVMLGACGYLVKPLKADTLCETIALHIAP